MRRWWRGRRWRTGPCVRTSIHVGDDNVDRRGNDDVEQPTSDDDAAHDHDRVFDDHDDHLDHDPNDAAPDDDTTADHHDTTADDDATDGDDAGRVATDDGGDRSSGDHAGIDEQGG
jgi:hypothetical protein